MHLKFKDVPKSLNRADVPGVKVGFDLIHCTSHLQSSMVMSFVDVLVNVFDRLDGCADLQVNVTLKLHQQLWGIWHNIFVVKDLVRVLLDSVAIIRSCILWIAIILHASLLTEVFGKALLAESIDHTTICIARTMEHEVPHSFIELRMEMLIRDLGRDEGVNLLSSTYLVLLLKEDKEVHVRKTTFLIFNGVDQSSNLAIVAIMNLLQECLLLLIKDASHQVWTVNSTLTCSS